MRRTMAAKVMLAAGTATVAMLATACDPDGVEEDNPFEEPLLEDEPPMDEAPAQ